MTPKEEAFVFQMIEELCKGAYERGYADSEEGKSLNSEVFILTKANRLVFRTNLKKHTNKR